VDGIAALKRVRTLELMSVGSAQVASKTKTKHIYIYIYNI